MDYWGGGAKGYVGPPSQIIGGGLAPPGPPSSYAYATHTYTHTHTIVKSIYLVWLWNKFSIGHPSEPATFVQRLPNVFQTPWMFGTRWLVIVQTSLVYWFESEFIHCFYVSFQQTKTRHYYVNSNNDC